MNTIFNRKKIVLISGVILIACSPLPVQAGLSSLIKDITKIFKSSKSKKKQPEVEVEHPAQAASTVEEPRAATSLDIQDVVETLHRLTNQGPEICSALINGSIGSILDKAEHFLTDIRWAKNSELTRELESALESNLRQIASTILLGRITGVYQKDPLPVVSFVQAIALERFQLDQHETNISELLTNNWFTHNATLERRIKSILLQIEDYRANLDKLEKYASRLTNIRVDAHNPNIVGLIYDATHTSDGSDGSEEPDNQERFIPLFRTMDAHDELPITEELSEEVG